MQRPNPSLLRFSDKVLKWFIKGELYEEISGDLYEYYYELEDHPTWKRRLFFWFHVFNFLRPFAIKNLGGTQKLNYYGMFKHNLLISFRGFKRHKTVFGINVIGLIASLTCVLFSTIWISDELNKDRFHEDSEKIFQVFSRFNNADGISVDHGVTGMLEAEIEAQIPQASIAAVTTDVHEYTLALEDQAFRVNGRFGDEDYLKMLHYPLWKGNKDALADPSNILITKSLAKRIFGKEDVLGETLDWRFWNAQKTFRVAGILEDVTSASSESFEFILPWTFYHDQLINYKGWGNYYGRVLVKLSDLSQKEVVENKINEIFQSNLDHPADHVRLFLKSYSDKYLYGKYEDGVQAGGRIDYVYLAMAVAVFILLIACINFINLSTAFSSLKVKEIGVKKSFGASRRSLASQFFFESILLAAIATTIALILTALLLQPFNTLTGKQLDLTLDFTTLGIGLVFIPLVGMIAGLYPAVYLSGMEVIAALKNKFSNRSLNSSLSRKTLVFVQFSLSIILIVGTLIVSQQMNYALNKNLGYDRDNLLYFLREGKILENSKAFKAGLEALPGVKLVSQSGFSVQPGYQNRTAGIDWEGKGEDQNVSFWENNGDAKSAEILGLELVAGRFFDDQLHNEEKSIIFNETAIGIMGLEDPIGKIVEHHSGKKEIIGVVKDFTTESLHNPMEPSMFHYKPAWAHYILVKIEKGKELSTIAEIESVYKNFNPNYPFDPRFVDQDYQAMYDSEMRVAKLSSVFSGLAIIISCMGLFGLTIFQVQRKIKEIGIKKVLGAETWKLALSMTYDFTKSVFAALIVALPLSYFLGIRWLESFSDSITLSWWMFAAAALVAIVISWLTVGTQTLRAANANPAEALKDE